MSALITQALDENLKILLIANPSELSHFLINKIQQQANIEVELVPPLKFTTSSFSDKSWYKVVFLFENPLTEYFSMIGELSSLSSRVVIVMPMNTAVEARDEESGEWARQIKHEFELFDRLVKNIDVSRFILYSDLVEKGSKQLNTFFSKFHRGLLIDPNIELKLQTRKELVSRLSYLLLKPQKNTAIVGGKSRLTGNYLRKIKSLYSSQRQINVPIKRVQLKIIDHPILGLISGKYDLEVVVEKIDYISKKIMVLFVNFKKNNAAESNFLQPPVRKNLGSSEKKKVSQSKIRLDLEHDLDRERNSPEEVTNNVESRVEAEQKNSGEKQVNPVNSLFKEYGLQRKRKHLQKLTKSTRVGFRKLKNQKFLFGGGMLVSLVAFGILISTAVFFINLSRVQGSLLSYLESRSMPVTAQQKKLVEMRGVVGDLGGKLALINKWFSTPFFLQAFQLVEISQLVIDLSNQVEVFEQATIAFFQQVMIGEGDGSLDLVNEESIEVFKTLSLLSAELKDYSSDKLSPEQSRLLSDYQDLIGEQEKKINQFQQLSPSLSSLLAGNEVKTYALLLQNNQELRPTGGFIQAVALLTFKEGSLISVQVEDVYTLDHQLKATISPPDEVRRFLGEERWFLRDSNWNPSFPESASRIKWFLEKSIAVKIDGVIGVNLKVLEEIVGVLDQVEVDEYNEVLTKRNLSERMEFHSEVQLVETAQNRDYAELVLFKILNKIQYSSPDQVIPLLSSLVEMADAKELLISVFDNDVEATFESLGWDGSIVEPACPTVFNTSECLVDSLMQVEANIGVNKANYYLERQIDHSITVTPQEVSHKRLITFKNKAQTNAWPKGPYKSYIRFYLPEESKLKGIKINGQNVDSEQLVMRKELDRDVVGVLIEVAVKSELELSLEYSLSHDYQTPFTYSFFDQKQSGARDISPRIFLKHDPDLSPILIAPQAEVQGDVVVFNPTKDIGHMFVGVSFE